MSAYPDLGHGLSIVLCDILYNIIYIYYFFYPKHTIEETEGNSVH